jgi:hypothetical protein
VPIFPRRNSQASARRHGIRRRVARSAISIAPDSARTLHTSARVAASLSSTWSSTSHAATGRACRPRPAITGRNSSAERSGSSPSSSRSTTGASRFRVRSRRRSWSTQFSRWMTITANRTRFATSRPAKIHSRGANTSRRGRSDGIRTRRSTRAGRYLAAFQPGDAALVLRVGNVPQPVAPGGNDSVTSASRRCLLPNMLDQRRTIRVQ